MYFAISNTVDTTGFVAVYITVGVTVIVAIVITVEAVVYVTVGNSVIICRWYDRYHYRSFADGVDVDVAVVITVGI